MSHFLEKLKKWLNSKYEKDNAVKWKTEKHINYNKGSALRYEKENVQKKNLTPSKSQNKDKKTRFAILFMRS